jgi:hypothetical protein
MQDMHTSIGKLEEAPKFAACMFAKAKRRATKSTTTHARITDHAGALTKNNLLPGHEVSIDHYICSTLGPMYTEFGKSDDVSLYKGGYMFVDNATGWVHTVHQTSLTSYKTLAAKEQLEFACQEYGIMIQGYKADQEASFTSLEFANHLRRFHQIVKFAGTGGHHHNGIAEKLSKM